MKIKERIIILSVILACIGTAFAATVAAQRSDWQNLPVRVYENRGSYGTGEGFDEGTYRFDRSQFGNLRNDAARSVWVLRGYRVRLCENEGNGDGKGRCEEYGEGKHNLVYPNTASFIRVWRTINPIPFPIQIGPPINSGAAVTVFEDRDSRGRSQSFGPGLYRMNRNELGNLRNDKASSIIVARGFRARLCENEGPEGRGDGICEEYNEGSSNLGSLNDRVSFIQVRRSGWGGGWRDDAPVTLFRDYNQSGIQQGFDVGTFRSDQGGLNQIGNDEASSVFVMNGYRVRICENENNGRGGGKCEEYGAGAYNLRYNDKASFVRVWRVY